MVFGTRIDEHVRCIGRPLSIVVELCVHLLYKNGLREEGLFRIPGSAVKIKKLKNAINAWFVTMASQGDMTMTTTHSTAMTTASTTSSLATTNDEADDHHNQQFQPNTLVHDSSGLTSSTAPTTLESGRGAMMAINNLFKEIASHKPRHLGDEETINDQELSVNQYLTESPQPTDITGTLKACPTGVVPDSMTIVGGVPTTTSSIASTVTDVNITQKATTLLTASSCPSTTTTSNCFDKMIDDYPAKQASSTSDVCYDLHTIAGLLKLYLRELPEPLFTFDLYHEWISATVKSLNNQSKEQDQSLISQANFNSDTMHVAHNECDNNYRKTTDANKISSLDDSYISGSRSHSSSSYQHDPFEPILCLLEKLPRANYDNLAHLIKFLHILTNHIDSNKMSASNLAITMAPSLIWAPADQHNQQLTASLESSSSYHSSITTISSGNKTSLESSTIPATQSQEQQSCSLEESMQALNMHITSVGMSTSLNALVIENLIKNADMIFPEPVKFSIPFLDNHHHGHQQQLNDNHNFSKNIHCKQQPIVDKRHDGILPVSNDDSIGFGSVHKLNLNIERMTRQDGNVDDDDEDDDDDFDTNDAKKRAPKSTSPTAMSTTSSSSFSSGSSISHDNRNILNNHNKPMYSQHTERINSNEKSCNLQTQKSTNLTDKQIHDDNHKSSKQFNTQINLCQVQQNSYSKPSRQPPPIPPLPKCKLPQSYQNKATESDSQQDQKRATIKSPVPAIPATNINQQEVITPGTNSNIAQTISSTSSSARVSSQSKAISLRGTGTVPLTDDSIKSISTNIEVHSQSKHSDNDESNTVPSQVTMVQLSTSTTTNRSIRPSVPPPSRPERLKHLGPNPNSTTIDQ